MYRCILLAFVSWLVGLRERELQTSPKMAMPWDMALSIAGNVWVLLDGWISTCFLAADEVARLLRSATH